MADTENFAVRLDSGGEPIRSYRIYPFIPDNDEIKRNVSYLTKGFGYKIYTSRKFERYSVYVGNREFVESIRRKYGGGEIRVIDPNGFELPVA